MDDFAASLLSLLKRSSVTPEQKLAQFNTLKSQIKHQRVSETAQQATVECVRVAISTNLSSALVIAGFSTLGHLIKRLVLQDQVGALFGQRAGIEKALLERLGDQKEPYRNAASSCLADLWAARPETVERIIRENAIGSTNVRAKEMGMIWVSKMHEEHGLQFRNYVGPMIECLDHADGNVRESAKMNLIELFKNAPDRAKIDLKRQLGAYGVRHSISSFILSQVDMPGHAETQSAPSAAQRKPPPRAETPAQSEPKMPDASNGVEPSLPPSAEATVIEPLYVDSHRELEDIIRNMQPCFEGKEDESNWKTRDNNVLKLRRLNKGNALQDHHAIFVAGIKTLLDGILKVANTLRTTMSTNGCQLVQELARSLGSALDPMAEILLQNFVKMCSATKHISAQNGNTTVDVIFSCVSYNTRLMQHVWLACQDKNLQPRICACGWLKTILKRQAHSKAAFEHSGGLELADKCIKKGLADANPKVRESMRGTYWAFATVWPEKGTPIMDALDPKSKSLLVKDPANPNKAATFSSSVGSSSTANPRAAASKPSIRDAIAAQRRAALNVSRPNSAMATLSPVKQPASVASRQASGLASSASRPGSSDKTTGDGSSLTQGSLRSAPVRRPRKPEVVRPQTADPYANRRLLRTPVTPTAGSPVMSPERTSSKSTAMHNGPSSHTKAKSTNTISFERPESRDSSRHSTPKNSPIKTRPKSGQGLGSPSSSRLPHYSPKSKAGDTPSVTSPRGGATNGIDYHSITDNDRPRTGHSSVPSIPEEDDDNFTLVIPARESRPVQEIAVPAKSESSVDTNEAMDVQVEAKGKGVTVYEDPVSRVPADEPIVNGDGPMVLEELPVNEQLTQEKPVLPSSPGANPDERPISPSKRSAEAMKNQRLLVSGVQRVRAKTLDAHGLRRLQDIIKAGVNDSSPLYAELLKALMEFVGTPAETLSNVPSKAQALKLQALANLRTLTVMHHHAENIRRLYADSLCAVIQAKRLSDGSTAHVSVELEKTVTDIIRHAGEQADECIDAVMALTENDMTNNPNAHRRVVAMALSVLTKLLHLIMSRDDELDEEQKVKLGRLAVHCLDDVDADVRRAATEFCLQFRAVFPAGGLGNTAFWEALRGVREAQANLVAYYIARKTPAV